MRDRANRWLSRRFIFFCNQRLEKPLRDAMSNIVMAVSTGRTDMDDICTLQIHRPISLNTLLLILNTPMQHATSRHNHVKCDAIYGRPRNLAPGEIRPDCRAVEPDRRPTFRPVETVTHVELEGDGRINGNLSIHQPRTATSVILRQTEIHLGAPEGDHSGLVETAVQLLHISARQTDSSNFADQDRAGVEVVECLFSPQYVPWHVKLAMNDDEAEELVSQVRPSCLARNKSNLTFARQIEHSARREPLVLQNRIFIGIGVCDSAWLDSLFARVRSLYERTITSPRQLLPRHPFYAGSSFGFIALFNDGGHAQMTLVASVEGEEVSFACKRMGHRRL